MMTEPTPRMAVIGGGVAGLSAARRLREAGVAVQVFDKGRGPAGRISTRHAECFDFDHGAQYFTARRPAFRALVHSLAHEGVLAPWTPRLVSLGPEGTTPIHTDQDQARWVGVPGMSALARRLARDLEVRVATRITSLERRAEGWILVDDTKERHGTYDAVVLALPAPQAAALLARDHPLRADVEAVSMSPCLALMLGLPRALEVEFDGAFVNESPLAWIARNSSKPGRPPGESWVLHAAPEWSRANFDADPDEIARELLSELAVRSGAAVPPVAFLRVFRWRYARTPGRSLEAEFLEDPAGGLVVCGDWCGESRIEDAWHSGRSAAESLLEPRPARAM